MRERWDGSFTETIVIHTSASTSQSHGRAGSKYSVIDGPHDLVDSNVNSIHASVDWVVVAREVIDKEPCLHPEVSASQSGGGRIDLIDTDQIDA